jgi:hypothetical protein
MHRISETVLMQLLIVRLIMTQKKINSIITYIKSEFA